MRRIKFLAILASVSLSLLFPAIRARGQVAPAQFFWVCYSAANEPSVYVSGLLQGPATAAAAFRVGFVQALMQRYSYQGNAACVPARTQINAQDDMNRRVTALRNAKKNVVETGWTEAAPAAPGASGTTGTVTSPLGSLLGTPQTPSAPATPAPSGGNPSTAQGGASSTSGNTAVNVLDELFGASPAPAGAAAPGSAGTAASAAAKAAPGQAAGKTATATGTNGSPAVQVASTLSGLFKGSTSSAPGGASNSAKPGTPGANGAGGKGLGGPPAAAPSAPGGLPQGALGSAQYANTMLVVYGCGRQGTSGTQVLCVTDLTNQNQKDTLVQSDAVWKDAFVVDDRGDRHTRTNGYFLNVDGEQRQQLDIDYGKTAHFILAFDGIPAKVEKIELRSATGGLNVNAIPLIAVGASSDASTQAQAGAGAPAAQPAPAH